jgi:hypothetical protein
VLDVDILAVKQVILFVLCHLDLGHSLFEVSTQEGEGEGGEVSKTQRHVWTQQQMRAAPRIPRNADDPTMGASLRGKNSFGRELWQGNLGRGGALSGVVVRGGPPAGRRVSPTFCTAWRVRRLKALTLYIKSFFFPPSFSPSESLILEVSLLYLSLSLCPVELLRWSPSLPLPPSLSLPL